jgi:hypothetical protein
MNRMEGFMYVHSDRRRAKPRAHRALAPIEKRTALAVSVLGVNVTAKLQLDDDANEPLKVGPVTAESPEFAPPMVVSVRVIGLLAIWVIALPVD